MFNVARVVNHVPAEQRRQRVLDQLLNHDELALLQPDLF